MPLYNQTLIDQLSVVLPIYSTTSRANYRKTFRAPVQTIENTTPSQIIPHFTVVHLTFHARKVAYPLNIMCVSAGAHKLLSYVCSCTWKLKVSRDKCQRWSLPSSTLSADWKVRSISGRGMQCAIGFFLPVS